MGFSSVKFETFFPLEPNLALVVIGEGILLTTGNYHLI